MFPDARIVQTHRDPVAVTASMTTMAAYTRRTNYEHVDPHAVGATWSERIEAMLLAAMRDRDLVPADQVMDVRFDEYMADQMAVLHRVYDLAGVDLTDDTARLPAQGRSTTAPGPARPGGVPPRGRRASTRPSVGPPSGPTRSASTCPTSRSPDSAVGASKSAGGLDVSRGTVR